MAKHDATQQCDRVVDPYPAVISGAHRGKLTDPENEHSSGSSPPWSRQVGLNFRFTLGHIARSSVRKVSIFC